MREPVDRLPTREPSYWHLLHLTDFLGDCRRVELVSPSRYAPNLLIDCFPPTLDTTPPLDSTMLSHRYHSPAPHAGATLNHLHVYYVNGTAVITAAKSTQYGVDSGQTVTATRPRADYITSNDLQSLCHLHDPQHNTSTMTD